MSTNTPSRVRRSTSSTGSPACRARVALGDHVAADHRPHQLFLGDALQRLGEDEAPVAQDRHPLADGQDLLEAMGDEDDGRALVTQRLHHSEQPPGLDRRQGGGRLVHDQHTRAPGQRLGDLHQLLLGDREPAGDAIRVDAHPQPGEDLLHLALHRTGVDAAAAAQRLAADEDVLGDRQVGEQRWLLVDDRDPALGGVARAVEEDVLAVDRQRSAVGLMDAAEDLDQRRLPGAVLADERMGLAGVELQGHVLQGVHAGERLAGVRSATAIGSARAHRGRSRDQLHARLVAQKLNLSMLALSNTCGGPSTTE